MYSLLFLVIFLGCYLLYVSSKKAKVGKVPPGFLRLARSTKNAKIIAGVLFILYWVVIIIDQGFGSGTFTFGGYIMTALSVVVFLKPLQYTYWKHLLRIFVVSILIESYSF